MAHSRVTPDPFSPIARHYDALMVHVDYDRWLRVAANLTELLPRPFLHLDAGCGTGVFLKLLENAHWHSAGVDLSESMLLVAAQERGLNRLARADLCALPFDSSVDIVTCLFDSMNFLLREEQVRQALVAFRQALRPGGLLYFDVVTRRMVADHFNNETWTEDHGPFRSAWSSRFDAAAQICETRVRIDKNEESVTFERIYPTEFFFEAIEQAGLTLLAARDANTWKRPGRRTTRIDFIAVNGKDPETLKKFKAADAAIHRLIGG